MKRLFIPSTLFLLTSLACTLTANLTNPSAQSPPMPGTTAEPSNTETSSPTAAVNTPAQTGTPSFASGTVCFASHITSGTLRVRACPGLECKEVGLLEYGDLVTTNRERKETDGSSWLHLLSPIEGWANSRYICESEANR